MQHLPDWRKGEAQPLSVESNSGDYWRDRICHALPGLTIDWLGERPVQARLKAWRFAEAEIVETAVSPLKVSRGGNSASCDGGYKLVLHLSGHGRYRYAGNDLDQGAGDLVLLDTAMPFCAEHPKGAHVLVWGLPREALAPLLAPSEWGRAWYVRECAGMGAVLSGYLRTLAKETGRLTALAQRDLQMHLGTLVALALRSSAVDDQPRRMAQRAFQQQRIFNYIETRLYNPMITAERAAQEMAMSRRWLHALLEDGGESFSSRLVRRRLEEGQRLLCDSAHAHRSVAEIAFMVGFNDVSTFHRQFRRYYGVAPRDARRACHKRR